MTLLVFLFLALACTDGKDSADAVGVLLGAQCEKDGTCPEGLEPVVYCGIGGEPCELCSCEITCGDDASSCPEGTSCTTIADGPGDVCREE
jgi:hypothetical protein